jgi:hypothetical protein
MVIVYIFGLAIAASAFGILVALIFRFSAWLLVKAGRVTERVAGKKEGALFFRDFDPAESKAVCDATGEKVGTMAFYTVAILLVGQVLAKALGNRS